MAHNQQQSTRYCTRSPGEYCTRFVFAEAQERSCLSSCWKMPRGADPTSSAHCGRNRRWPRHRRSSLVAPPTVLGNDRRYNCAPVTGERTPKAPLFSGHEWRQRQPQTIKQRLIETQPHSRDAYPGVCRLHQCSCPCWVACRVADSMRLSHPWVRLQLWPLTRK